MSKLLKEFREFAIQGNMIDMAVGMIIGAAFKDLVNSLVSDMVMPVIGLFTGKLDFSNMFISLNGEHYATLAEAQATSVPSVSHRLPSFQFGAKNRKRGLNRFPCTTSSQTHP